MISHGAKLSNPGPVGLTIHQLRRKVGLAISSWHREIKTRFPQASSIVYTQKRRKPPRMQTKGSQELSYLPPTPGYQTGEGGKVENDWDPLYTEKHRGMKTMVWCGAEPPATATQAREVGSNADCFPLFDWSQQYEPQARKNQATRPLDHSAQPQPAPDSISRTI